MQKGLHKLLLGISEDNEVLWQSEIMGEYRKIGEYSCQKNEGTL